MFTCEIIKRNFFAVTVCGKVTTFNLRQLSYAANSSINSSTWRNVTIHVHVLTLWRCLYGVEFHRRALEIVSHSWGQQVRGRGL